MPTVRPSSTAVARYVRNNPRRSPRWRYDRAQQLQELRRNGLTVRPDSREDDSYVINAYQFLRRWDAISSQGLDPVSTERERIMTLFDEYPGLYYAYELFTTVADDVAKWHIEAYILADQDDEEIGQLTGYTPDAIAWYERLFFNVRERLNIKTYIDQFVLAKAVGCGIDQANWQLIVKFWAYYGGRHMLDGLLSRLPHGFTRPGAATDLNRILNETYKSNMAKLSMLASSAVGQGDINRYNFAELCNIQNQLLTAAEESRRQGSGAMTPLEETVSAILGGVRWAVGTQRKTAMQNSPLNHYMGNTVELRADEQLRIAAGLDVGYSAEDLSSEQFPDPPSKEAVDAKPQ